MPESKVLTPEERISQATKSEQTPKIYFNGFVCAQTNSDIMCVIERTGEPIALLNMSFTTAKTLAQTLANVVATLENAMGRDIMTTHDVETKMNEKSS